MASARRIDTERPTFELKDDDGQSRAEIAAWRGGMLTSFSVQGRELLYLDRATLDDASKNVRGGNPVLFPSPGKLANDAWSRGGQSGSMKQHGFARNLAWEARMDDPAAASVTLVLVSNDATRAQYPWDFRAEYTYSLRGNVLRIEQRFANESKRPMPFGAGFHPYFAVAERSKPDARVVTSARRAFDNVTKREVEIPATGIALAGAEVDLHLLDHGRASAELDVDGRRLVTIEGSPEFRRWVVWTLPGKDFVCLEPWTCPGDALNTGVELLELAPGASRTLWIELCAPSEDHGAAPT